MHTVIGLDPGTINTGFAVLTSKDDNIFLIDHGVLQADSKHPIQKRLLTIGQKLKAIYQKHPHSQTAIEKVFLGKNTDTAFKLGMAVGTYIYEAGIHHSQVTAYPTRFIKQSITGHGDAKKEAVRTFICNYFQIKQVQKITLDASDAIAVALCHIRQTSQSFTLLNKPEKNAKLHGRF